MAKIPYTTVPGKLERFLGKIQEIGQPEAANRKWLASIGFKAANDGTILTVMRSLGFIDQSGHPTGVWAAYRDSKRAKGVFAQAVRKAYPELFKTYADAPRRSDQDIRNHFVSQRPKAAKRTVSTMVASFKALCKMSDFAGLPEETAADTGGQAIATAVQQTVSPVTVNINVQLTLPDSKDEALYDRLFSALKKHLLP